MTPTATLLLGAVLGIAAGSLLVPVTRRELAAAVERSAARATDAPICMEGDGPLSVTSRHWLGLVAISGLLPAYVLHRVGWSPNALPPLLLLIGLIQLAYCDLSRRLLPKTLVYALTVVVFASGALVAVGTNEWHRLLVATLGALGSFALFFAINLMNPHWMAFGDVRLSLVFGFGLAWISPMALFQAFLYANILALVVGVALIALHRADRRSAMPFGVYMALGAGLVLLLWS
jgi:leader peptidase (prepilin peptidase) / N-methyltransferase